MDEITSQIEAEQLSTRRKIENLQKNNPQGLFGGGLDQEVRRIQNESLSKVADLSIIQNSALRKYSTVKDIADRKIEAETEDLKTELDGLKFFYQENKDTLDKKEQRAYEEKIKAADRAYTETYNTKKELSDTKLELLRSAAEQNAPAFVLQGIQNSLTAEDAIKNAGQYAGDILDRKLKQAQYDKIYKGISADPSQILAYAQQYASTGLIPTGIPKGTFGLISQVAKETPKSPGQILDKATGVTPDKLGAAGDAYGALYSAIELSKQLKELDENRWGGLIAGSVGKITGSSAQAKYDDLRTQIVDLLARARSGAALTITEEKRYSDMLPGRFNNPFGLGTNSDVRIDNFTNNLTSDLTNKVNSKGWVVNGISKVNIGGTQLTVGDVIENSDGTQGRVNADGTITKI